jgi:hypothetical protein
MIKQLLVNSVKRLPYLGGMIDERDRLRQVVKEYRTWVPPGHFYSPIPSIPEIKDREREIFDRLEKQIPGIDLNEEAQLALLEAFQSYSQDIPFKPHKSEGLRYHFENPAYSYSDGIFYYCMIRHLNPKRIVEVGSGYSSSLAMDVNELFYNNEIALTCIEPYPDLLLSLMKPGDKDRVRIVPKKVEEVELSIILNLLKSDILFIDSTHVSRVGSDVNRLIFEILPRLAPGVHIHFHDIFFPFEYLREWIYEGRAWNEAYLLRAFLQYNSEFRVVFFNTFLQRYHRERLLSDFPLTQKNTGGSIWLTKT